MTPQQQAEARLQAAAQEQMIAKMLETSVPHVCDCGSKLFRRDFVQINKISALVSGTNKEEALLTNPLACVKCHAVYSPPKAEAPSLIEKPA